MAGNASRGSGVGAAALLFMLDVIVLSVLSFGVVIASGFEGTPDRGAIGHEAGRAALVCVVGIVLSAVPAGLFRKWAIVTMQVVVLGGAALIFAAIGV